MQITVTKIFFISFCFYYSFLFSFFSYCVQFIWRAIFCSLALDSIRYLFFYTSFSFFSLRFYCSVLCACLFFLLQVVAWINFNYMKKVLRPRGRSAWCFPTDLNFNRLHLFIEYKNSWANEKFGTLYFETVYWTYEYVIHTCW